MADPLTEVLRSVRLTGGVFLDVRMTAPWSVLSKVDAEDLRPFLATAKNVISYHCVTAGRLLISIQGEAPVEVHAGEVVLIPRNEAHTLASAPGITPLIGSDLVQPGQDGGLARIVHGGGGEPTNIICGFLGSEDLYNPLIASLPRLLKLDVRESAARDWVEASLRFAAHELTQGRLASSATMARLSELLLVEAVRNFADRQDDQQKGWMKGLADPYVGRALALMHQRFSEAWTAEALAQEVSLSRSAFVERFTTRVGLPPIRYLSRWRLQTARLNLREVHMNIAHLAHSVGYESEEAFSRAFKREYGISPAHWRDGVKEA